MRLSVPGVRVKTQFDGKEIMSRLDNKQRWGLAIGGVLLTLLLAAVFTFGSLNVPFEPKSWRAVMVLYAVSSFITDRKSTRLNSSHRCISYAVFCLKKK